MREIVIKSKKSYSAQKLLKLAALIIALYVGGLYGSAFASNVHRYSEKECLALTEKDTTYGNSVKRISKLKLVSEFNELLKNDKLNKVSLVFFSSEPRYIKDKCFWYIRLEENHETHMVFWKSFLVDISGTNIYAENIDSDSYSIAK